MMNFKYFIISLAEKQTIIDKFTSLSSKLYTYLLLIQDYLIVRMI